MELPAVIDTIPPVGRHPMGDEGSALRVGIRHYAQSRLDVPAKKEAESRVSGPDGAPKEGVVNFVVVPGGIPKGRTGDTLDEFTDYSIDRSLRGLLQATPEILESMDWKRFGSHFRSLESAVTKEPSVAAEVDWSTVVEMMMSATERTVGKEYGADQADHPSMGLHDGWSGILFSLGDLLLAWVRRPGEIVDHILPAHKNDIFCVVERMIEHSSSPSVLGGPRADPAQAGNRAPRFAAGDARILRARVIGVLFGLVLRDAEIGVAPPLFPRFKTVCERAIRRETDPFPMLEFGRHFWVLHQLDPAWARSLLPLIFPESEDRRPLYVSSFTGLLATPERREFFEDEEMMKLYARGFSLRTERRERQSRGYFFEPELGVANHLASAFVSYEDFGFEHELLQSFLSVARPEQLARFVEFAGEWVGRDRDPPDARKGVEFVKFWRWLLEHCEDRAPFLGLEYWIHTHNGLFDPVELARLVRLTLEKTDGDLLDGHVNLGASLASLAQAAPEDTVAIIGRVVFGEGSGKGDRRLLLRMDPHWREAARILAEGAGPQSRASVVLAEIERQLEAPATKLRGEHG